MNPKLDNRALRRGLLVGTLFAMPLVAVAGCRHHGHHGHHKFDLKKAQERLAVLFDYLDATEDQRQQIQRQLQTVVREVAPMRRSHHQAKQAVLAQWNKAQPDKKALHALVDRQLKQVNTLGHKLVDALVDVHRVLNPTQRAKLTKLLGARIGH